jgi:beta-lactamase regulating signal transducer with metallopeptidase domain
MLLWIVITALVFALTIVLGNYFKAKNARENKLKKIAKRLEQIEKREQQKDNRGE